MCLPECVRNVYECVREGGSRGECDCDCLGTAAVMRGESARHVGISYVNPIITMKYTIGLLACSASND